MVFITISKLDKNSRRDWGLSLGDDTEISNFRRFDVFLTSRIRALKAMHGNNHIVSKTENKKTNKSGNVKALQVCSNSGKCLVYEGTHPLHHCKTFINQSIAQRLIY